ncbi:MAG TPA: flagellar hook-length control protein FliK [Polyangiaceae bacterium]|nr:flagellar hook-length control protein FliK [Polyangiaceae bacterium]
MNSGSSAGGLSSATRQVERDESRREQGSQEAAALWVALAQKVTSSQSLPLSGEAAPSASLGQSGTTSAWHPSAGDLTPAGAAVGAASGAASGAAADSKAPERLVLRVDGGHLGELEVTLERQEGGMRVVIGMENQHLVGSVLPDAHTLKAALEGAGVNVQSLNVVPASEVGTVLAQRRLSPSGPKPAADEGAEQQENEKAQKRNHKRLTLIG